MSGSDHVTVIGSGAFGLVMAMLLHDNGVPVRLWGPTPDRMAALRDTRDCGRYLPGHRLPPAIDTAGHDGDAGTFKGTTLLVSAIPTQGVRPVFERLRPHVPAAVPVVSVSKGLERTSGLLPTGVLRDLLGDRRRVAALSGPSVADELARQLPATLTVASADAALAAQVQRLFKADWFRVYTHDDLLGVELAGALKNVIALAAGIVDGLNGGAGLGINAKSALLARGLAEVVRLGTAMGADAETFYGITGVGDLATTCFSPTGRNRSAGERLGRGEPIDAILADMHGVVEGVPTVESVVKLAAEHDVEMPIATAVHAVLFEGLDPAAAVHRLMTREPRSELD